LIRKERLIAIVTVVINENFAMPLTASIILSKQTHPAVTTMQTRCSI